MFPENIREFMEIRWALGLAAVAVVAFGSGMFYSYLTDPGITADDGSGDDLMEESDSGSQGTADEEEAQEIADFINASGLFGDSEITKEMVTGETDYPELILPTPSPPDDLHQGGYSGGIVVSPGKSFVESAIEQGAIITPAYGPTTAGTRIVLPDGRAIQLPEDAYIESGASAIACLVGQERCHTAPAYAIARGDATILVDGKGIVSFHNDEARGSSAPEDFDFMKHLITDPDELWSANTGVSEAATSTPSLPE